MPNRLVTPVYRLIFEQDSPYMSEEAMKAFLGIADWYGSPNDMFVRVFSADKSSNVLPKFALDVLVMQEATYHISVGLTTRM